MSRRKIEPEKPTDTGNVVVLRPGGPEDRRSATATPDAVAQISAGTDTITHDGLDLLRAFFAIDDAAARASLVILAQRLAAHSPKR
jgi:hypothetical protein